MRQEWTITALQLLRFHIGTSILRCFDHCFLHKRRDYVVIFTNEIVRQDSLVRSSCRGKIERSFGKRLQL